MFVRSLGLFLLFFLSSTVFADQEFIPPRLADPETTEISLLTVGLGESMDSRYGHTMIRVQDPGNRLDYLVNWGIFDFSDPMFVVKFFRGILIYRMGFSTYGATLRHYRNAEHRPVWEDHMNLTAKQKIALVDKIIWNAQPENLLYNYQYWYDNCATKPRDYLNTILFDKIRPAKQKEMVGLTYRDYVRNNLAINPIVGWGLDVLFNADNDKELTAWQEMFYPAKLREHLASIPAYSDDGLEIPNTKLLSDHRTVVDIVEPDPNAIDGYWFVLFFVTIPLLVLLIAHGLPNGIKTPDLFHKNYEWRIFGFVALFWGCTSGFFGLVHTSAWLFSAHTDLHRNLNILLFWPVDFLIAFWGIRYLIWGDKVRTSVRWQKFWQVVAVAHLGVLVIYVLVGVSGVTGQYVLRVLGHMVPASILFYYTIGWRVFARGLVLK